MKKIITAILLLCLAFGAVIGVAGCSNATWSAEKVTLKPSLAGALKEQNGFVAETENFIYFINGVASDSSDNGFGVPIKGSLVAFEKATSKKEIVVPKLFATKDYNTAFFIDGEYVYYASPSTDKTHSGTTASDNYTFFKTKLDGTGSQEFFTVSSSGLKFRFIKDDNGQVFVVYHQTATNELCSFNYNTKEKTVIASVNEDGNYSLNKVEFIGKKELAVVYTVTVYKDLKVEAGHEGHDHEREEKAFNQVYAYKVGDKTKDGDFVGKKVLDGSDEYNPIKFEIPLTSEGYVFVKSTDSLSNAKYYGYTLSEFYALQGKSLDANKFDDGQYITSGVIVKGLDEVYVIDSTTTGVKKTSMIKENRRLGEQYLTGATSGKTLVAVENDFVYYYDDTSSLLRSKINPTTTENYADKEQIVSSTTTTTNWFAPQVIGEYIYYCDSGENGMSYVNRIPVNAEVKEIQEPCDNEEHGHSSTDAFHNTYVMQGSASVSVLISEDKGKVFSNKITAIANDLESGRLVFNAKDAEGKDSVQSILDARAYYEGLSSEEKKNCDEFDLKNLYYYEEAVRISNIFQEKIGGFNRLTEEERTNKRSDFDYCVSVMDKMMKANPDNYEEIQRLLVGNLNADYYTADKYYNPETDDAD